MARRDRATLKQQIARDIPDNVSREVSPMDCRVNIEDLADSAVFPGDPELSAAGLTAVQVEALAAVANAFVGATVSGTGTSRIVTLARNGGGTVELALPDTTGAGPTPSDGVVTGASFTGTTLTLTRSVGDPLTVDLASLRRTLSQLGGLTQTRIEAIAAAAALARFSDAEKGKLQGVEANATADQTGAEIITALEAESGDDRLDASAVKNLPEGGADPTVAQVRDLERQARWIPASRVAVSYPSSTIPRITLTLDPAITSAERDAILPGLALEFKFPAVDRAFGLIQLDARIPSVRANTLLLRPSGINLTSDVVVTGQVIRVVASDYSGNGVVRWIVTNVHPPADSGGLTEAEVDARIRALEGVTAQTYNEMIAAPSQDLRIYTAADLVETIPNRDALDGNYIALLRDTTTLEYPNSGADVDSIRIYVRGSDLTTTEVHREPWTRIQDRRSIPFNISAAEESGASGRIQRIAIDGGFRNAYHFIVTFFDDTTPIWSTDPATLWLEDETRRPEVPAGSIGRDKLSAQLNTDLAEFTTEIERAFQSIAGLNPVITNLGDLQSITVSTAQSYSNALDNQAGSAKPLILVMSAAVSGTRAGTAFSWDAGDVIWIPPTSVATELLFTLPQGTGTGTSTIRRRTIRSVTASASIVDGDRGNILAILDDSTSNVKRVQLPPIATAGEGFEVTLLNAGVGRARQLLVASTADVIIPRSNNPASFVELPDPKSSITLIATSMAAAAFGRTGSRWCVVETNEDASDARTTATAAQTAADSALGRTQRLRPISRWIRGAGAQTLLLEWKPVGAVANGAALTVNVGGTPVTGVTTSEGLAASDTNGTVLSLAVNATNAGNIDRAANTVAGHVEIQITHGGVTDTTWMAAVTPEVAADDLALFQRRNPTTVLALTDAASIAWNADSGLMARVVLGGNRAIANPTNVQTGDVLVLQAVQDGTGNRTLSWGSNFLWAEGSAPTLSTAANALDVITFLALSPTMLRGHVS